jgi:CO/xanthine dehydrogenase Mo-binding subunit
MASPPVQSRRQFLKLAASGVVVIVMPYPSFGHTEQSAPKPGELAGENPNWMGAPGKARYRIDGIPKVTGAKLYARDFSARDMKGWPEEEAQALVLRVTRADREFTGLDLKILPPELQPFRVVTSEDLERDKVTELWSDEPGSLLVPAGQRPTQLGQPAAILFFKTAQQYRDAARLLQFNKEVLQYGTEVPVPPSQPFTTPIYLTRYEEEFSQAKDGPSNPTQTGPVNEEAKRYREKISQEMQTRGWRTFSGTFSTQVVDPLFMEPETGLAWYNAPAQTLHLLMGTQSTNGDVSSTGSQTGALFAGSKFAVSTVQLYPCYPGGGFGGRDTSPFLSLLAVAAVYAGGPVRLAHDRFEQFQSGIKRNASNSDMAIAVDETGKFQALKGSLTLHGGGKKNYSQFVSDLAAFSAGNSYDFPMSAVESAAMSSTGVTAGSMRGFGGPQAFFAVESLVDEIAEKLAIDPIELRRRNALKEGDHTVTGAPLKGAIRLKEICDLAQNDPLWTNRKAEQRKRAGSDRLYGVGFALAMQAYGTGLDGVMAGVEIDAQGAVSLMTNCVDMGNGSATSLAISTARYLGANAARVNMGEVDSLTKHLPLQTGGDDQWDNPLWTASFSMSSSACLTAFHQVHVVEQASRVIFLTGLWPAARTLWGLPPHHPLKPEQTRWEDGRLLAPDLPPLLLRDIARQTHTRGGVVAAMVHAVYQAEWVTAEYQVGDLVARWPIDGLATRQAKETPIEPSRPRRGRSPLAALASLLRPGEFRFHPRRNTEPPPKNSENYGRSLYAPSGALVAIEINRRTGEVSVLDVETFLDAGRVVQPQLLIGQSEGAVAMGIGYALLEELPLETGGAGEGTWNLDRYKVPLAGDIPHDHVKLTLLPPTGPEPKGKGIAEAVLCPIAPAIANAIAAATGQRFRSLPITPEKIRERLG